MTSATSESRRGLGWLTLASLIAFMVLVGLGWWQLERLAWKEALLADMRAGLAAPPVTLQAGHAPARYTHVTADGRFIDTLPGFVFASRGGGAGYLVIRPFRLAGGEVVLVDTGFVPEADKAAADAAPASGETVQVTGFTVPGETSGLFTPQADVESRTFYIRDIVGLPQALGLVEVEPYLVELSEPTPAAPSHALRQPERVIAAIPNRHLGYALTWFGLAAALAGVYIAFVSKTLRKA